MLRVVLGIFLLIGLLWGFLQTETGQNWMARQVTKKLSRDLQTHISIKNVKIGLFSFDKMDLEGLLVEDQKKDTLLYAGKFQVRITDWFFFRDKAELKYVGIEDATIHLNRTDSTWNYDFLKQYFSSSSAGSKKKEGIEFDLKKVMMKNVTFISRDGWIGSDMIARIGGLDMDANEITVSNRTIDVSSLVLNDPYFSILEYSGKKHSVDTPEQIDSLIRQKGEDWKIRFGNVKINNGRFRNDRNTYTPSLAYFDGFHVDFSSINGTLKNIGWTEDTVTGYIDLTAKERSGLVVKSLQAKTTFHPKAMIFDELNLVTNRSRINDYFSLHYNDMSDMSDFLHKVVMEGKFKNSVISSDDIAYFSPNMRSWKKNIRIDGEVRGTVDAISSKDLELWAGNNTYLRGAVSLVGLPNINETMINVDADDLRTNYADAVNFIPAIRKITTPALNKISYLRFNGSYTGFINNFVTFGTIHTNLGTLRTDMNMKFPKKGTPVYAGNISTAGFQLGDFINNTSLGSVSFNGNVKGKGFDWQTLDMDIDGQVHSIDYGNYTYRNITAKGTLSNRLFNGDFVMKDPNADLQLKGLIDFRSRIPIFRMNADIAHANLKTLQLSKQDLILSGKFELDLQASSLSDLLGTARIYNASLINNGRKLSFDSLMVSSNYVDGLKKLRAVSNEFDATVTGDFDLEGLPDAFTLFLHQYYPSYIVAPRYQKPQVFTFDITTGNVEDYIQLIDPRLTGFNNSHITGSLNTTANTMTVDANVPYFKFAQYSFSDVALKGSGDLEKLVLTGEVTNAQIGDSLFFPQTSFSIQARNDVSDINITTTSNQAIHQANISAQIKTFHDGATVLLKPSGFVINGKTWTIEQGGELNFRKNTVVQGQVLLREANQEIRVWTEGDPVGDWNNLHVELKKLNLGDFTPLFIKSNRIEGLLSGEIKVEDPQNRFTVTSNLRTDELRVDNDSIGTVMAELGYNKRTGMLTGKGFNADPEHKIEFDLAMNLKDSSNAFQDRINTKLTNFELKYLNRFLGVVFSDMKGYATGNFDILGEGSNRSYTAKARIRDAGFKVNFTQVYYTIDDTEIELKKDLFDLNNIRIRDTAGNSAIVKGFISHNNFSDMYYDIAVQTESRQMQLLNTDYEDNQQFYGRAIGSGSFVLVGFQNDLLMNIAAQASDTDSSFITLPPARSRESGQANFMVERTYGREMVPQSSDLSTNVDYDIQLSANPMVNIEVILDEVTGDKISGRGEGNLRITSGTSEPLTLQGRYNITSGTYEFTFQSFLEKPFVLKEGANNYIEWNGDPYDANVRIEALYTAKKVSFAPLASLFSSTADRLNRLLTERDDVNVNAVLTGNLFQPDFTFRLEFPTNNPLYNTPDFQFALNQMEKNQNELNKQVTYLIVFNSFAPFENVSEQTYNPLGEFTYNTISGLLFGKVNEQLNRILAKILRNNNATLNFTGSLYNRNLVDATNQRGDLQLQSTTNFSLSVPIFNERAQITIGATLNVPITSDIDQTIQIFPDVALELKVNKTGSVRANFFYRQNVDFFTGGTTGGIVPRRYGASIGYNKEFNSFGELFSKKKNRPRIDSTKVPADSTGTH